MGNKEAILGKNGAIGFTFEGKWAYWAVCGQVDLSNNGSLVADALFKPCLSAFS
jgi:hypothetical protein